MSDYQSEIHKLLKLHGSSDESHVHLAPEGLPILHQEELSMPSEMISHSSAATATMNGINNFDVSRINFKSLLIYPVIFCGGFYVFLCSIKFSFHMGSGLRNVSISTIPPNPGPR